MQKDKAYITYLAGRARLRDRAALEKLVAHFSRAYAPERPQAGFAEASAVRAAIDRLKPVQAATIRLFYIEEMSLMPQIQADRVLRELKRVELLILHRTGEKA